MKVFCKRNWWLRAWAVVWGAALGVGRHGVNRRATEPEGDKGEIIMTVAH